VSRPRYSYDAINDLALSDTGHFVYLDSWSISLIGSMLSQERPIYLWANEQNPLSDSEIDDLDNKLSTAQGQIMQSMVGLVLPIITQTAPTGTLVCDGSTYLRVDYPNLYAAIDPGLHIDANSFIVPDLRDRFILGSSATNAPFSSGGSFDHIQTISEMASHAHTTADHTHSDTPHSHAEGIALPSAILVGVGLPAPSAIPGIGVTGLASVGIIAANVTVNNEGSSDPMDITPPFYALKYVVVAL